MHQAGFVQPGDGLEEVLHHTAQPRAVQHVGGVEAGQGDAPAVQQHAVRAPGVVVGEDVSELAGQMGAVEVGEAAEEFEVAAHPPLGLGPDGLLHHDRVPTGQPAVAARMEGRQLQAGLFPGVLLKAENRLFPVPRPGPSAPELRHPRVSSP